MLELEKRFIVTLNQFSQSYREGDKTKERISAGNILHQLTKMVSECRKSGDPSRILDIERHCEQLDLANFATTSRENESSIQTLRMLKNAQSAVAAPANPEQYRVDLMFDVGEKNMDKITSAPPDAVHLLVKSQRQKLARAAGRMKFPPAEGYFRERSEALQTALKLHEKNCENALGISRSQNRSGLER